ncbi:MAG: hypothetical protein RBR77_10905 [Thauera sp.]|nr:hypothetical protein [Thauera sp.]
MTHATTFQRWPLLFTALLALLLNACASFLTEPQYTTAAEVLKAKGEPSHRWEKADGSSVLEYATQPYGNSCLMVEVDASGTVLRQWDALAPANLARVKQGMSKDEIRQLLGEERSIQHFKLSGEEVWDWNIRNNGPGIATLFNVHFIDDKVVRSSQTYVYPRDGGLVHGPMWYGHPWAWYGHPWYGPSFHLGYRYGPFGFWY